MIALILANLGRRKARPALTARGIAVGVAAIVALLALSTGHDSAAVCIQVPIRLTAWPVKYSR